MEGSLHLTPNEASVHAQEYGFGGSYFEDELYATDEEGEDDIKPTMNGEWGSTVVELQKIPLLPFRKVEV